MTDRRRRSACASSVLLALAVSAGCGGPAAAGPPAPSARPAPTADKPYTSLDQALADPEHVHALILSRTRLTVLPPAIGKLVHLRALVMNRNADLTEIPDELGHLPELAAIYLGGSPRLRFADVFRTPQQLPRLEGLGNDDNQLGAVPDELAGFPRLKRLGLSGDALTALPPSIGGAHQPRVARSPRQRDHRAAGRAIAADQAARAVIKGNPLPALRARARPGRTSGGHAEHRHSQRGVLAPVRSRPRH